MHFLAKLWYGPQHLTPLDYFLLDYLKFHIYADKPETTYGLEENIRRVIVDIWPQLLEKWSKSVRKLLLTARTYSSQPEIYLENSSNRVDEIFLHVY